MTRFGSHTENTAQRSPFWVTVLQFDGVTVNDALCGPHKMGAHLFSFVLLFFAAVQRVKYYYCNEQMGKTVHYATATASQYLTANLTVSIY